MLQAKTTIMSRKDWGAIVRYGDTDSLFVHLPGKTKDEAFLIGNDIAQTITRMNPKPVKLKFEKVRRRVYRGLPPTDFGFEGLSPLLSAG